MPNFVLLLFVYFVAMADDFQAIYQHVVSLRNPDAVAKPSLDRNKAMFLVEKHRESGTTFLDMRLYRSKVPDRKFLCMSFFLAFAV